MDKISLFECDKSNLAKYQCKYCDFKTDIGIFFCAHFQKFHGRSNTKSFKIFYAKCCRCGNCNFSTFSYLVLLKHNLICQENYKIQLIAKYQCPYCLYKAVHSSTLNRHIIRKHTAPEKIEWHKCDKCDYKGKIKAELTRHINIKHKEKIPKYKCNKCEFKTIYKVNLKIHTIRFHTAPGDIKFYQCEHCSYRSKVKKDLKQHIKTQHKAEKNTLFYCDHCEYKAKLKKSLEKHILAKHTARENLPKYQCIKCNYKTIDRRNLNFHIIRHHTDSEWYQCEHCSYKTKIKLRLTQHLKEHYISEENVLKKQENVLKYECDTSTNKTMFKEDIKRHIINAIQFLGGTNVKIEPKEENQ